MIQRRDARFAGIASLLYIAVTMTSSSIVDGVLDSGEITQQLSDLTRMIAQA